MRQRIGRRSAGVAEHAKVLADQRQGAHGALDVALGDANVHQQRETAQHARLVVSRLLADRLERCVIGALDALGDVLGHRAQPRHLVRAVGVAGRLRLAEDETRRGKPPAAARRRSRDWQRPVAGPSGSRAWTSARRQKNPGQARAIGRRWDEWRTESARRDCRRATCRASTGSAAPRAARNALNRRPRHQPERDGAHRQPRPPVHHHRGAVCEPLAALDLLPPAQRYADRLGHLPLRPSKPLAQLAGRSVVCPHSILSRVSH
ncbi:MAG: hypothetical protein MZV70_14270 [Desulfobacterales bacterium]|nr:hypothetical protein [Desulfobacterales bacterium]